MHQLIYDQNYNGKLFPDVWSDLRPHDAIYSIGVYFQIIHKNENWGVAEIVGKRTFGFNKLSDVVSFICSGKPAHFQAALLNNKFGAGQAMEPEDMVDHIVLHWIHKNPDVIRPYMTAWMESSLKFY